MSRRTPETKVQALAAGVAAGMSLRRSGKLAGVPPTTARRLASEASFRSTVVNLREQIISQIVGRYVMLALRGSKAMAKLLDEGVDAETRLKAIRGINADLIALKDHGTEASTVQELKAQLVPDPAD